MEWYLAEIAKCTYRQFTTGFYFGKPSEESQIYDSNTYISEYIYLGLSDKVDDNYVYIEQKNKFAAGDIIEIMKPDGNNVETKVLKILDEDGNEMESCPHPQQKLRIALSVLPEEGDILRVKGQR